MNNENKNQEQEIAQNRQQKSSGVANPFENHQSADKDIQQSKEEVDKEQQFKEALTERD